MRVFLNRAAAVLLAVVVFAVVFAGTARADEPYDTIASTLSGVAVDKGESDAMRIGSLEALLALEYEDASTNSTLAVDKTDSMSVRSASLPNLCMSGSANTTVKSTFAALLADKSDSAVVRAAVIRTAAKKLDLDTSELRDDIWTVCSDTTDADNVRVEAVRALAQGADSTAVGNLVSVMGNTQDAVKVRVAVLMALRGSEEAGYKTAVGTLITTELAALNDNDAQALLTPMYDHIDVYRLRLCAINVARGYTVDAGVLAALRAVASDDSDNWPERICAINILRSNLDGDNVESTLSAIVGDDTDLLKVRQMALNVMCSRNSPAACTLARGVLADTTENADLREKALVYLAYRIPRGVEIGFAPAPDAWGSCTDVVSTILTVVRDTSEDGDFRIKAIEALRWADDADVLSALRTFVQDTTVADDLRIIAIEGLAKDAGSVTVLTAIAADTEDSQAVRDAAAAVVAE